MRRLKLVLPVLVLVALLPLRALALVTVLPVVTATTSTGDTGVPTSGGRYAEVMVWLTSGTGTVLLEELKTDTGTASSPWVTIKLMVNCTSGGIDASSVPCSYSTLTPAIRTRLRVSVCAGCTVYRVIQLVPGTP